MKTKVKVMPVYGRNGFKLAVVEVSERVPPMSTQVGDVQEIEIDVYDVAQTDDKLASLEIALAASKARTNEILRGMGR